MALIAKPPLDMLPSDADEFRRKQGALLEMYLNVINACIHH
jgi:hypothetical protein